MKTPVLGIVNMFEKPELGKSQYETLRRKRETQHSTIRRSAGPTFLGAPENKKIIPTTSAEVKSLAVECVEVVVHRDARNAHGVGNIFDSAAKNECSTLI